MKTINIHFICIILLLSNYSFAQFAETDQEAKAAMTQLAFIVGDWSGEGWMMGRDREKRLFDQTENIRFKLDSAAILIEGVGSHKGEVVHNALAIVTYDKAKQHYNFRSYLANGRVGEYKAELIDDKFYWYPRDDMRYIIEMNDQGQWFEVGEMNREGTWYQFFEMTLNKE
ncbi:MAG TPA: hypothetical protein DDY13_01675 [Cytophagales bacterium]|jgi:hypothetical protein|nr:hypothetical protein [Cytophagales bacterium]